VSEERPSDQEALDRDAILARRKRWIAMALAGAAAAVTSACAHPCLSPRRDGGPTPHDAGTDTDEPDAP
jgi:hypothetical protein